MNDITKLLGIEDETIEILQTVVTETEKIVSVRKKLQPMYCPACNCKMYSRGLKERIVRHQILQDGYKLILKVQQRRWRCTNLACNYDISDYFSFVNKYKQTTNTQDILVVKDLKNINKTFNEIAREHNISDHHVTNIFERYIKMKRLSLTEAISVDEVYLNMDPRCKYVLVIQDFKSGDVIDLVKSRQEKDTLPYFASIPFEERLHVKYLISDMYNPYISYVDKYFPKAVSVVDSFHVMQWLLRKIDQFLRDLLRYYRNRDKENAEKEAIEKHTLTVANKISDEVYLLEHHKWVLLKNESNIHYSSQSTWNSHFHCYVNSYFLEHKFMSIHPDFSLIRTLKEEYVSFNSKNAGNPMQAAVELDDLIYRYQNSDLELFQNFSKTLSKYREQIINSFIMFERTCNGNVFLSRLSNGPMESLNRKAKDLQRMARGYTNFNHLRNRFLYSARNTPTIQG